MAQRPIFIPNFESDPPLAREMQVEFKWYAGMSIQQKQRSIDSLHLAARNGGISPVLEISTKSRIELGRQLSAFNLTITLAESQKITVEAAFQGGKVFEKGGPYRDFYTMPGRDIKKDERLRNSGRLLAFEFNSVRWPLEPKTAFYDWLYLNALYQHPELSRQLLAYKGFSDIEFNPEKSLNCQARSAALYVALHHKNLIEAALTNQEGFIAIVASTKRTTYEQSRLI